MKIILHILMIIITTFFIDYFSISFNTTTFILQTIIFFMGVLIYYVLTNHEKRLKMLQDELFKKNHDNKN